MANAGASDAELKGKFRWKENKTSTEYIESSDLTKQKECDALAGKISLGDLTNFKSMIREEEAKASHAVDSAMNISSSTVTINMQMRENIPPPQQQPLPWSPYMPYAPYGNYFGSPMQASPMHNAYGYSNYSMNNSNLSSLTNSYSNYSSLSMNNSNLPKK